MIIKSSLPKSDIMWNTEIQTFIGGLNFDLLIYF